MASDNPVDRIVRMKKNQRYREWCAEHREEVNAAHRKWYSEHKEQVNAQQRERYHSSPEYREKKKAKALAAHRRKNAEKCNANEGTGPASEGCAPDPGCMGRG